MPCLYAIAAVVIQNQYFAYDISKVWVAGIARLGCFIIEGGSPPCVQSYQ